MDFKFARGIYLLFPCNTLYMLNIYIHLCLFWHKKSRPAKGLPVTINSNFKKSSLAKFFINCYLPLLYCPYAPRAESAPSKHSSVPPWEMHISSRDPDAAQQEQGSVWPWLAQPGQVMELFLKSSEIIY